jgi:hypothetical protein
MSKISFTVTCFSLCIIRLAKQSQNSQYKSARPISNDSLLEEGAQCASLENPYFTLSFENAGSQMPSQAVLLFRKKSVSRRCFSLDRHLLVLSNSFLFLNDRFVFGNSPIDVLGHTWDNSQQRYSWQSAR